jgi:glutamyl-tRNA reductase
MEKDTVRVPEQIAKEIHETVKNLNLLIEEAIKCGLNVRKRDAIYTNDFLKLYVERIISF